MDGETDLQGELKLSGLAFGTYSITTRAPGFADHHETVRVTEHRILALTIDLIALHTIDSGWPYEPPLADLIELTLTDDSIPLIPSIPLPILTHNHRLRFHLHRCKNPT